jgi:hypothetical protein
MSLFQFSVPSASASSNNRPTIILPPPRDISGLQDRRSHHHNQIRPSEHQRSSTSTQRHQLPSISSLTSRPAHSSSSRTSFIPTQSGSTFSHWAAQDPFDTLPRPRRSVLLSARPPLFSNNNLGPSESRRADGTLPFAPSPPSSQAGSARQPRPLGQRQSTPYNSSTTFTTSRASTSSDSESATAAMPAPRQTRKRRATTDLTASSPSASPAPSTISNKRRATRTSTASSDRPLASSFRAPAQRKRTAPLRRTDTKKEPPADEPIVFDSSDVEQGTEYKVIDLVDKDEVLPAPEPDPAEPEKEKNTVKLGTFQCVICMDDVTDLTVTHCGMSLLPLPQQTSPPPHLRYFY